MKKCTKIDGHIILTIILRLSCKLFGFDFGEMHTNQIEQLPKKNLLDSYRKFNDEPCRGNEKQNENKNDKRLNG